MKKHFGNSRILSCLAALFLLVAGPTATIAKEAAFANVFGKVCIKSAPTFEGAVMALQRTGGTQASSGQWSKESVYFNPEINLSGSDGKACSALSLNVDPKITANAVQKVLSKFGAHQISGKRRGARTVFTNRAVAQSAVSSRAG